MNDPVVISTVVVLLVAFVGFVFWRVRRRNARFADGFLGAPDLAAELPAVWGAVTIRHRDPRLPTVAKPITSSDEYSIPYWQVRVANVRLGRETSLRLDLEGVLGRLREAIGIHDIRIGIEDFDRQFAVRGDAPECIRTALADPAVREAITTFFAPGKVHRCHLKRDGVLEVELRRHGLDPEECRAAIQRTRALATALDRAAR